MANIVWNKVSCSDTNLFNWMKKQLINPETNQIDFNILSPTPDNLKDFKDINDWRWNNWGSPNSIYDVEEDEDEENSIIFYTKWSEPSNIISILQNKLKEEYKDEDCEIIWDFNIELSDDEGTYYLTPKSLIKE